MAVGNVGNDKTYETYFENGRLWHAWEIPVTDEHGKIVRYTTRRSEYAPEPSDYRHMTEKELTKQEAFVAHKLND